MVSAVMTKTRARRASARAVSAHDKYIATKRDKNDGPNRKPQDLGPLITSSTQKRRRNGTPPLPRSTAINQSGSAAVEDCHMVADMEDRCQAPGLPNTSCSMLSREVGKENIDAEASATPRPTVSEQPSSGGRVLKTRSSTPLEQGRSTGGHSSGQRRSSSILETIFSPVFHLFKGHEAEGNVSPASSVEQAEPSGSRRTETVATRSTATSRDIRAALAVQPCPSATPSPSAHALARIQCSRPSMEGASQASGANGLEEVSAGVVKYFQVGVHTGTVMGGLEATGCQVEDSSNFAAAAAAAPVPADHLVSQAALHLECSDEEQEGDETKNSEEDEYDDFDPFLFIKRLPMLAEVVPACRPQLLPKQTRRCPPVTLVLDLDETLVHSSLVHCADADFTFPVHFNGQLHTVYVKRRPWLENFMERVAQLFEIIVFTASQSVYAEQLLNVLDPQRRLIRHRVFRDSCVYVEGNYLKDLTILGRDLSKVAIVDNSPQAFGFQVDNGIPIESWFDDRSDRALEMLFPFLETLVAVEDVRPVIASKFNLKQRVASAVEPRQTRALVDSTLLPKL
eukprot:jgi/Mesen1/1922/ME000145S01007